MLPTHEHAHTHVRTQGDLLVPADPVEHSRHSNSSGRTGGGIPAVEAAGIPVVEVHEGAKRPGMRIIPDSPEKTRQSNIGLESYRVLSDVTLHCVAHVQVVL